VPASETTSGPEDIGEENNRDGEPSWTHSPVHTDRAASCAADHESNGTTNEHFDQLPGQNVSVWPRVDVSNIQAMVSF
jgi:hypothetical protein